jgi:hypothetical protein
MKNDIVNYRNANIIEAFRKVYKVSDTEAEDIFIQMLNWFIFCENPKSEGYRNIDDSTVIIDEMWHTFILFTPDYFKFCKKYIGHYIHHMPSTNAVLAAQRERAQEEIIEKKRKQYELVYDILGKETFVKWYHEYAEKYSREAIKSLRLV